MLQHPFQCLAIAKPPGASEAFLLAACGARLVSTSLGKDATFSEWIAGSSNGDSKTAETEGIGERPTKKQKTSPTASTSSNVIKIALSPDHQYAVVVTEDKIVRVFELHGDGTLHELSQRAMPKRPCAIEIWPDNATILCGDKFGDVYSLPLLPEDVPEHPARNSAIDAGQTEQEAQVFKPSASVTTVHTKRNRKALEAQMKQKNLAAKTKEPLAFDHKLLLGHVSMLTDLVVANREVKGKQRNYIITADRDEHIRVSRGPPQSHIIEGYCLAHTDFISKICLVPGTDLLVSGGGDTWIGVWQWPSFKLKRKIEVLDILKEGLEEERQRLNRHQDIKVENINISGIWIVPMKLGEWTSNDKPVTEPAVVVACEGVPAMLVCPAADLTTKQASFQTMPSFDAPILDISSTEEVGIAALDDRTSAHNRVQSFRLERDKKIQTSIVQHFADDELASALGTLNGFVADVQNEKALDSLFYGVANLRKRGYQNDERGGEAEVGIFGEDQDGDEVEANEAD